MRMDIMMANNSNISNDKYTDQSPSIHEEIMDLDGIGFLFLMDIRVSDQSSMKKNIRKSISK